MLRLLHIVTRQRRVNMDSFTRTVEDMVMGVTNEEELLNLAATLGIQGSPAVRFRMYQLQNPEHGDVFVDEQLD